MTLQSRPQQPTDVDAAGQRNLINVGEDKQGPWAGWGIGSYADPDEEGSSETYAWRDELIEPGRDHQLLSMTARWPRPWGLRALFTRLSRWGRSLSRQLPVLRS